jgi:hypothetical protein
MTTLFNGIVTAAGTTNGVPLKVARRTGVKGLSMQVNFIYGSSGTTCDVTIQTSLDSGNTWVDLYHATQFTTASGRRVASVNMAASLAEVAVAGTALAGGTTREILGDQLRAVVVSTGTYATNTQVIVDCYGEQLVLTGAGF